MATTIEGQDIEACQAWKEIPGVELNIYKPSGHLKKTFHLSPKEARELAIQLLQAAEGHESFQRRQEKYFTDYIPF